MCQWEIVFLLATRCKPARNLPLRTQDAQGHRMVTVNR